MCKTKYFDGWTIKTRFFPSFLFAFFAVLSLSFGYEMPQQFRDVDVGQGSDRGQDYLCIPFGRRELFLEAAQISFYILLAKMHHMPIPKPITIPTIIAKKIQSGDGGAWKG